MERRLSAILAADVVGYSRLMGENEAGTLTLKAHRADLIEPKTNQYGDRTIKLMGDGILIEFTSVVDAVTLAVDVQTAMQESNAVPRKIGRSSIASASTWATSLSMALTSTATA